MIVLMSALGVFAIGIFSSNAEEGNEDLFQKTKLAMEKAQKAHADLLAPSSYSDALESYQLAEEAKKKNENLNKIQTDLARAIKRFAKAAEATKLAKVTLAAPLEARYEAQNVGADKYAAKSWNAAEDFLMEVAQTLEKGDTKTAEVQAPELIKLYRNAEKEAKTGGTLNSIKAWVSTARTEEVKVYAPNAWKKLLLLQVQTQKTLEEEPKNSDQILDLAQKAESEAGRALYLTRRIKEVEKNTVTMEEFGESWAIPMEKIATAINIVPRWEEGPDKTTGDIIRAIERMRNRMRHFREKLDELEDEKEALEEQLKGKSQ